MPVGQMPICQSPLDRMTVGQMPIGQMYVGLKLIGQMPVDRMSVCQSFFGQNTSSQLFQFGLEWPYKPTSPLVPVREHEQLDKNEIFIFAIV